MLVCSTCFRGLKTIDHTLLCLAASADINIFWTLIPLVQIEQVTLAPRLLTPAFISPLFSSSFLTASLCSIGEKNLEHCNACAGSVAPTCIFLLKWQPGPKLSCLRAAAALSKVLFICREYLLTDRLSLCQGQPLKFSRD